MFRKQVNAKQITTTNKNVKTPETNNTSITPRVLDGFTTLTNYLKNKVTTAQIKSNQSFVKELMQNSTIKKPVRPARLLSISNHTDLENTKRNGAFYSDKSKKMKRCSGDGLMTREDMSKTDHGKLLKSESQHFVMSNFERLEDNKMSEEEVHSQDLNNSNIHENQTAPENFSSGSSSQHEPPFIFGSPPRSKIVTLSQICANPPGAPRALFGLKSNSFLPSPLYLAQMHFSSSELDESSIEKESSDNDGSGFSFLADQIEF